MLTPGARTLLRTLKRLDYRVGIVSGGFTQITDHLTTELGLDYSLANTLDVADGRRLALEALWRSPMPVYLTPADHPGPDELAEINVDFSPDGRWLVTDDGEDGLLLWSRSGGAPSSLHTGQRWGGRFLPDSRSVISEYQSFLIRYKARRLRARDTGSTGIRGGCGKRSSRYSVITCGS